MTLFSTNYAYRLRTSSIFEDGKPYIFDVFIVHNDIKLAEFDLFNNLWKETLILSQLKDPKIQPVLSFGQLPEGIIYREIEEVCGYSLEEYIKERQQSARIASNAHMRKESLNNLPAMKSVPVPVPPIEVSPLQKIQSAITSSDKTRSKKSSPTYFTEVQAIDLCLKLVDLLELIHDRNVVHTNFSPQEIFLKEKKMHQMQFLNLYHCAKDPSGPMGFKYVKEEEPNISKFDIRTRNISYISPEQVTLG